MDFFASIDGNAAVVTAIGGFLLTFIDTEATQPLRRSGIVAARIVLILLALHLGFVDHMISRVTRAVIGRFTTLDIRDYAALLSLENDYAITELHARAGDWIVGWPLASFELTKEGVLVLSVRRADRELIGAPRANTTFEHDDRIVT